MPRSPATIVRCLPKSPRFPQAAPGSSVVSRPRPGLCEKRLDEGVGMDAKALGQAFAPAAAEVVDGLSQSLAVLASLCPGRAGETQEWKRRRGHWIEDTPPMKRLKIKHEPPVAGPGRGRGKSDIPPTPLVLLVPRGPAALEVA